MKMSTKVACLAAGVVMVTTAACSSDSDQLDDAPVGIIDDSPVFVMTNADDFPNVAVKCYEGSAIYTTTRDYGDAVNIVPGDPACEDGNPIPKGTK